MTEFIKKHKKPCIIAGTVIIAILLIIYLRVIFLPGLWHQDAFLYKQPDGSFKGNDIYAEYTMKIDDTSYGKNIEFSVNGKTNHYQIKYDENDLHRNVEISENGVVICKGNAIGSENDWYVFDEKTGSSDMISIRVGNEVPKEEELFPNCSMLYNWSVRKKTDTRGEPWMLFLIALFSIIMLVDIKFPNLFWILEHRFEVEGGEPSEWYRFKQKVSYIIIPICISVCVILTFKLH